MRKLGDIRVYRGDEIDPRAEVVPLADVEKLIGENIGLRRAAEWARQADNQRKKAHG